MAQHQLLSRQEPSVLNAKVHKIRSVPQHSPINTGILSTLTSTLTMMKEVSRNSVPIRQTKWQMAML